MSLKDIEANTELGGLHNVHGLGLICFPTFITLGTVPICPLGLLVPKLSLNELVYSSFSEKLLPIKFHDKSMLK